MKKVNLFLIAIMTTATLAAQTANPPSIDVQGEGTVHIVPDEVTIKVRVEHSANEVKGLKEKNDQVVREVLKFVKNSGISEKDVRTEYMNLNKNYDYNTKKYSYSANQSLSIRVRDLSKYESLMRGLLESGINRIDGVSFSSSEKEKLESEARKKAVQNAKLKAEEFASVLGQKVGKAIYVGESQASIEPRMMMRSVAADYSAESDPSMALGEMEIKARVLVKFLLE